MIILSFFFSLGRKEILKRYIGFKSRDDFSGKLDRVSSSEKVGIEQNKEKQRYENEIYVQFFTHMSVGETCGIRDTNCSPPPLANIRKVPQSSLIRAHVCREAF